MPNQKQNPMNLRQLTYFRAVIEHGSLAAASEVLHVAQPNLSVAIRQLETAWGITLFDRVGRGLVPTDAGRLLHKQASCLLGDAAALEQEMRAIGQGSSARIRIGFTAVSMEPITAMVAQMRQDGSDITFSLLQSEPQLLETMVEMRQLDFAVTHLPVANSSLHVRLLAPLKLMLVTRTDDARWAGDGDIELKRLSGVSLVLLRRSAGVGIYDRLTEAFAKANLYCAVAADCTDLTALYVLIQRNVGVGLLPTLGASKPQGFAARAVLVELDPGRLALIHPRGRRPIPAVQRAIDLCRARLSS